MNVRRITMVWMVAAACALSAALYVPTAAVAAQPQNPVLADCGAHPGGLVGNYSVAQLRHALQIMDPETREYTSCPDVINRALLAALGRPGSGGSSGGGGSGSFLPTPVIVILVVLALAAVTFGALAIRRRQQTPSASADRDGAASSTAAADDHAGTSAAPAGESHETRELGD